MYWPWSLRAARRAGVIFSFRRNRFSFDVPAAARAGASRSKDRSSCLSAVRMDRISLASLLLCGMGFSLASDRADYTPRSVGGKTFSESGLRAVHVSATCAKEAGARHPE